MAESMERQSFGYSVDLQAAEEAELGDGEGEALFGGGDNGAWARSNGAKRRRKIKKSRRDKGEGDIFFFFLGV